MKIILQIILIALLGYVGIGQDTTNFFQLGSQNNERGIKLEIGGDGIVHILTNSGDQSFESNANIQIIQVDSNDDVINAISIGTSGVENAYDFHVSDSVILIAGLSDGLRNGYAGMIYFIKSGHLELEKYNSIGSGWSKYSQLEVNGDSVITILESITDENESPRFDIYSMNGNVLSSLFIDELQGAHFLDFEKSDWGNGYLGCGYFDKDSNDAFLVRLSEEFEVEWIQTLAQSGVDRYVAMDEFSDSTIALAGYSDGFFLADIDIVIQIISHEGNPIDTLIQGYDISANNRDDFPTDLVIVEDTVYITGYTFTYGQGESDAYMTFLDKNIQPLPYSSTFGTKDFEYSNAINKYGRYVIGVGYTNTQGIGQEDVLYWKRKQAQSTTVVNLIEKEYSVSDTLLGVHQSEILTNHSFPKIIQNNRDISFDGSGEFPFELNVYNMNGSIIYKEHSVTRQTGITLLQSGIYLFNFSHDNVTHVIKVIVP